MHPILRRGRTAAVRSALVAGAVVALAVTAACGADDDTGGGDDAGGDRLRVVASFYPLAEAAARVGGDRVEVTNLTPAGTEPHDLELTPDQVDQLLDADVLLYLGEGFQPAVAETAESSDGTRVDLLESLDLDRGASAALEAEEEAGGGHGGEEGADEEGSGGEVGEVDEHAEGGVDPHFWLDPRRMVEAVDVVEQALAEAAPDAAATFASNADAYAAELTALDDEMAATLADCARDEIVTSHAAFHYLAERYGLTQLPIAGLSPESEPDADRLAQLTDEIEDRGITTVFYETLVSPDVAETLAREANVDTAVLDPLEGLAEEQVEAGEDYASVMRRNLAALADALGCDR